jgi:choline-sulfatase
VPNLLYIHSDQHNASVLGCVGDEVVRTPHLDRLADDTLVVYTSDHGDMLGERGLWWKHVFFEDSVRVPLIVSWPGKLPAGERCGRVVSSLDVTATILDALDAPALPESPGRSLLPLLNDESAPWDDVAFSEYCSDEYAPPGGDYHRMIRRGKYKLCYYHGEPPLLFDLESDPEERRNLAGDPSYASVRDELVSLVLAEWDPQVIQEEMVVMKSRNGIIRDWVKRTDPAESIRWEMKEEMNYLEGGK